MKKYLKNIKNIISKWVHCSNKLLRSIKSKICNFNAFNNNINSNINNKYTDFICEIYKNSNRKSEEFVLENNNISFNLEEHDIKPIAFYLPQFHPIPENDKWWGKGFTEWTNVTKAVPQYKGHHQPQLPVDMGFYDLRNPFILKRQIELAKNYGLHGFCFHYYWFGGKRLLNKPIDIYFSDPEEYNFPFSFCWANENWSRRWDGSENELLIAQKYSPENDFAFIRELKKYFIDNRYIKINGKPLLIVYRPQIIPESLDTVMRWRKCCKDIGIGEIFIVGAKTFGLEDPTKYGYDAAVEFPPHNIGTYDLSKQINIMNPAFRGRVYDYNQYVKSKSYLENDPCPTFKTVFPAWDNTARKTNDSIIFYGSNPALYKEWLSNVINHTKLKLDKQKQFVFINAWNEWAEGAHLEPDRKYGYSFLQATLDAVIDSRSSRRI